MVTLAGCAADSSSNAPDMQEDDHFEDHNPEKPVQASCKKATAAQVAQVNLGNSKKQKFLDACARATNGSSWCQQIIRPNPESKSAFTCTYGANQVHQLIHPTESTWRNAIDAVQIVKELQAKSIGVTLIYNWWRPEPYNKNVGGAAGRHPFGTSVDVRFSSQRDKDRAFTELCRLRRAGRIKALGYYPSTALHIGVRDATGNTWGKSCP